MSQLFDSRVLVPSSMEHYLPKDAFEQLRLKQAMDNKTAIQIEGVWVRVMGITRSVPTRWILARITGEDKPMPKLQKIWKQTFPIIEATSVMLPKSVSPIKFLKVGKDLQQPNMGAVWFSFTPETQSPTPHVEAYTINVIGTGMLFDPETIGEYIDSFVDGYFIWHIFIKKNE